LTPMLKKLEVAGRFYDDDFCSANIQAEVSVEHRMIDRRVPLAVPVFFTSFHTLFNPPETS